ncbi:Isochorismate hydrolase [Amycolatopsis arida]|uniref:Isochorismate hydrolase n=1 Tax=Amycolatopsis arida TaxID=587909 RepID=A0A1I5V6A6_9PSEU|nr:isochorismatase family protein [Amycolatopsis arida]TDX91163.1 isochorismate hydrolase [Amycolatopsis arida]SFQ02922.1 Isochorismate hydrolase [Amycolatopsis arida]
MGIPALAPYPMPTAPSLPANQVGWRPDPARAVLLLHDMQAYFLAPYPRGGPPFTDLMANARRLRERAAALGVPVVYSAQPGGMDRAQRGLLHDFWGPGMSRADADVRIVEELRPAEGDVVLTKWRYSAFVRSGLAELISRLGRDQLVVCGVYAHVGCLMTAVDAFSLDIQPFLVADAVADFSAEYHRLALDYAALRCAAVLPTDAVLAALGAPDHQAARSGRPATAGRKSS